MSRIQVCCEGYQRNPHIFRKCDPVCDNECVNGICIAPNRCQCYPDHVQNLAGYCVATCPSPIGENLFAILFNRLRWTWNLKKNKVVSTVNAVQMYATANLVINWNRIASSAFRNAAGDVWMVCICIQVHVCWSLLIGTTPIIPRKLHWTWRMHL